MTSENRHSEDVRFQVPFVHRLRFTTDVFGVDQDVLAGVLEPTPGQPTRVQFWLDHHVAAAQPQLKQRLQSFVNSRRGELFQPGNVQIIPGGEAIKNDIHILERMLRVMNGAGLDRRSYVIAIGGGAVLDAVGFAAAIAHRGIRLVRLPTTTLAQGDSGIGVKNSVNLFGKKNWVGTFAVPWAVINDLSLLQTLPDSEFVAGFSESVKVSLLKDPVMFRELCQVAARINQRDMAAAHPMIVRSAQHHLRHITQGGDPFEMLEARPLDYGHWSAHKMESMTNYQLSHGRAVGIGVAIDTIYSRRVCGLDTDSANATLQCLFDLGMDLDHPILDNIDSLFEGLEEFRQHLGGRLTLTMLRGVGQPFEVHEIDHAQMRASIIEVRESARLWKPTDSRAIGNR